MPRSLPWLFLLALSPASLAADTRAPGPWRALLDPQLSSFDVDLSYRGDDILDVI